jgi:PTH1 family peptidyl-tRNA hydrolase
LWLLVGLGNPGPKYAGTRHNIGFHVIDRLASLAGAGPSRAKLGAEIAEGKLGSERVLLCKPMEFMNTSGQALVRVARFWKIDAAQTVVVHDELDVAFGRLKLAGSGGYGGHNGVRSIIAECGTSDFARVRFGISRPPAGWDAADYVLADFTTAERQALPELQDRAAAAVEAIVGSGLTAAMNRFNGKAAKSGDDA